jgi:hypothetical protein
VRLPVQVWTPFFWRSPFEEGHARDVRRARREWKGEARVWLSPDFKEVTRWTRVDQGITVRECVVPSETVNYFVITHIDSHGQVFPFLPLPEDWHGSVSGAYTRWLRESGKIYLLNSEYVPMLMPVIKDGKVSIVNAPIRLEPGAITPHVNLKGDVLEMTWQKSGNAAMLTPNQEVEVVQGPARYERRIIDGKEMLVAVSEKNPNLWAFGMDVGWDKPFSYMFGEGGGMDLAMHQGIFRQCIRDLQEGQTAKVLAEAETWLSVFTSPGETSIWHSWFAPMAQANAEGALIEVEERYNLAADTIEELHQSEAFHQIIWDSVEVVVAQDWLGYLWWDFYQDVQERVTIRYCEACGRVIRGGHRDRQFCSRQENPECFRKRNTISQRRKRTHRS